MRNRDYIIGVIGGHTSTKEVEQIAHKIGKNLARVGYKIVCGGLGGVMKAVCRGAKEENGVTIGIIPSYDKNDANEFVDIVIPTGLGYARNVLVVQTADVIIAFPGEYGTLSEIAYALQFKKPVISLVVGGRPREVPSERRPSTPLRSSPESIEGRSESRNWDMQGVIKVKSVEEAMEKIKELTR